MKTPLTLMSCLIMSITCSEASSELPALQDTQKTIALSFDDAPRGEGPKWTGDERARQLIDSLERARVDQVVFFVTPREFERDGGLERIRRYGQAGHLIANHSNRHHWLSRTDPWQYLVDIDRAEEQLVDLPGHRPWFRYPYLDEGRGQPRQAIVAEGLAARGLRNGYVTVDNYDWYLESKWLQAVRAGHWVDEAALGKAYVDLLISAVRFYDALAVEYLGRSPAHVLLLHENDLAAEYIDELVAALEADGWRIISPVQAYRDPIASRVPRTLKTGQGRVAALAIDAGADPRTFTHLAIEEDQIDAWLEQRKVFRMPTAEAQ